VIACIFVMIVMIANIVTNYLPFRNNLWYMITEQNDVPQKW